MSDVDAREPMRRGRGDDMDLSEGKTCADCVHCRRCCLMFGHIPADEVCDWSPSRFRLLAALAEREG
jgi:hypothetical protein